MINFFKQLNYKKILLSFYWLIVILLILDQGLKALFLNLEANYGPNYDVAVIDGFFYFSFYRNTGAAWSMFSDYPWILAVISFIATAAMVTYRIIKRKTLNSLHKALWAVVIAGTFGNFIDRAFYQLLTGTQGVVDFIHFRFGTYDFPVFNIADMCLVIGLITMIILSFIEDSKPKKPEMETKVVKEENHE